MDKYPDMGEVTGLRLELGRERDRADAFAAALKAEVRSAVAEVIREEIRRHLSGDENARLKAEVERLKNNCDYLDTKLDEELDKSAMLCGQVERLTDAITRGTAITPDAKEEQS